MIIKRKLYLEEQREYGLLSDITHSGIGRTYKKYIGRARRSIANKLEKDIASARVNGHLLEGKKYDTADFGVENKLKS